MQILQTMTAKTDSLGVTHTLATIRRQDGHRMTAWLTTCNDHMAIHRDLSNTWNPDSAFERELQAYATTHKLTLLH